MSETKLLLDERPLVIQPALVMALTKMGMGLNEAIILQQLHYFLMNKKNYIEGRYWNYLTLPEWQTEFPFWSISTIKRSIAKLEDSGIVISRNFVTVQLV